MKLRTKKRLKAIVLAGLIVAGGTAAGKLAETKVSAVYSERFGYDPDAKPNVWAVHNMDDLWNEMKRLDWFSVCATCLGGLGYEGAFGVMPPKDFYNKTGKWVVYKCRERDDFYVAGAYDDEGVACRVFLQLLQKRAQMRRPIDDWGWNPFRFLDEIEIR